MSQDNATVFFLLDVTPTIIQCKKSDKLDDIFKKFADAISKNKENYDYYYNSKIIEDYNKTISDLGKNRIDIIITVKQREKKRIVKIIKCPLCDCNDCILEIKEYHLFFSGCKYGHKVDMIFERYKESQNIDFSKIKCSVNGETQNNEQNDFYRCLKCQEINEHSIYICQNCSEKHSHEKVTFDQRNCYCEKHFNQFNRYCEKCGIDLCDKCLEDHNKDKDHIKEYKSMDLDIDALQKKLNEIKDKISTVRIIASGIICSIEGAYQLLEDYAQIAQDIVNKYNYNKDYKNYKILKSLKNLEISNQQIIEDLDNIINNKNILKRSEKLINLFLEDRKKYGNSGTAGAKRHSVEFVVRDDITINSANNNPNTIS